MFTIAYSKNTEEKFTKSWKACIENACIDFIEVYGDMSKKEFLELFEETLDGLQVGCTNDSVTLELGMFYTVTIKVLYFTNNKAIIELKF